MPRLRTAAALACTIALAGCATSHHRPASASCRTRTVYVEVTGSERWDPMLNMAHDLINEGADSAVVCDTPFAAFAVAGGGRVQQLLATSDLAEYRTLGTRAVREQRFSATSRQKLSDTITSALNAAVEAMPPTTSALESLYAVAAERSADGDLIVLISDFVESTPALELNRPLNVGDGTAAANAIAIPQLGPNVTLVAVGVAQVSGDAPPDATWASEIHAFAAASCARTGARCHLFSVAPAPDVLDPKETTK